MDQNVSVVRAGRDVGGRALARKPNYDGRLAILFRRSIQKLIDESTRFLKPDQIRSLVGRLNNTSKKSVADVLVAEWELIFLSGLATVGTVEHESAPEGQRRLDVGFEAPSGLRLTADVRLVSDANAEQENPARLLHSELLKRSQELNSRGIKGTLGFRVGDGISRTEGGRVKVRLSLPQQHDFKKYAFGEFPDFVERIEADPQKVHRLRVRNEEADLEFVFSPGAQLSTMSHKPYSQPSDLEANIVYNALKKKSTQIKDAVGQGSRGSRGVIICDGGCALLRPQGSGARYSAEEIIFYFLKKHGSVDFVCVADVENDNDSRPFTSSGMPPAWRFKVRVYSVNGSLTSDLEVLFERALDSLPRPCSSGRNAFLRLARAVEKPQFDAYRYDCGRSMSDRQISFSSRAMIDFITGRIDREQFLHAAGADFVAQIARMMGAGYGIESISLRSNEGRDDDCVEFTFGGIDPAIAPFRVSD
jgi:hypothetical protein